MAIAGGWTLHRRTSHSQLTAASCARDLQPPGPGQRLIEW
jgi:hypothetical protein